MTGLPRSFAVVLASGLALAAPAGAQQALAPDQGCMQQKDEYTCNWSSFKLALERSHTVSPQTGPMERATVTQLRSPVRELGKMPVTQDQPADLTFSVAPVTSTGVNLGPNDHDLARLTVYAPTAEGGRVLLWVETYRGQGDRPWPAQVHALLTQFQERVQRHN